MSRRRNRRLRPAERKERADRWGKALLALVGFLVVGGGGFLGWEHFTQVTLDEAFCPSDGPVSITAVLLDRTDRLSPIQQADVRQQLEAVSGQIPTNGLLAIYSVGPTEEGLLEPEFRLCNPGRGNELNPLIANPRLAENRWREFFGAPLQGVFDSMLDGGSADSSPIMESIQSVALAALENPGSEERPKQLVIVSDMLQHTSGFSHYRGAADFSSLRESEYYRQVHTDLGGAEVRVLYVRRSEAGRLQDASHLQFWLDYFLDQNATPSFKAIQG